MVEEPSVEESIEIMRGLREKYEAHHKLTITDEALEAAAKLSSRYISDRFLPDKAIDLIDEASSRVRLASSTLPPEGKVLEKDLKALIRQKEQAIRSQEFEKASDLRDKEAELREQIREMAEEWKKKQEDQKILVTVEHIAHIVSSWTGVPVSKLTESESEKLLKMEDTLHQRVIGQHDAVTAISKAIRRARVGLKNPNRPIGSFIFSGPTGVGKTELAKSLADYFFGSQDNIIRVDMSEYMERHTVSKLIGSPPGYVGYSEGGQLTEMVRRKPYAVILFDEIEKAHPDVFNILLQILDDGRLADSKGRSVDFKNTIIIMTSNVGARGIENPNAFGFSVNNDDEAARYAKIKDTVMDELKKMFRPEFLNRLDDTIIFHQLTKEEIRLIVDVMLKDLLTRLAAQFMTLEVPDDVKDFLAKEGYSPSYGARPLRRVIQKRFEDELSEQILMGHFKDGDDLKAMLKKENEKDEIVTFEKIGEGKAKLLKDEEDAKKAAGLAALDAPDVVKTPSSSRKSSPSSSSSASSSA
jgi:ATP-dependent Clp protease ATP-binding subunit ClpC